MLFRVAFASLALVTVATRAEAYSLAGAVGEPCHERLATETLRAVRTSLPDAARRIEPDANEQALIDDLPFSIDEDIAELAGATLLLAVRDNDLKGRGAEEVDQLAGIHGDPDGQREHCLRRPEHDEPDGSQLALDECKSFLRERFASALAGLDAVGAPDAANRMDLEVTLAVRGNIDASLPAFWVRIGQAMHALEDGFTHTYRTEDGMRVTAALNWIDVVNKEYDEARDGPPHSQELDRCDDPDALRSLRRSLATEASVSLLTAALDPGVPVDQRPASAEVIFERYLSYEPGCTFDNGWCNAPERAYADDTGCACTTAGSPSPRSSAPLLLVGLAVALGALRRRRSSRGAGGAGRSARMAGAAALLAAAAVASPLAAQTPPATSAPTPAPAPVPAPAPAGQAPNTEAEGPGAAATAPTDESGRAAAAAGITPAPPPPGTTPTEARAADVAAARRAKEDPEPWRSAFGISASFSAAYDNLALAGSLGGRFRFAESWIAGIDAEYNPFMSFNGTTFRTGVFNGYATLIRRWPMRYESVNFRTTVHAGTSVLLMDLYGAPSGSVGLYLGASPLGVEWKASRTFYVIVDPLNVALPVPQLSGVPFAYGQYRTTIGLEIDP